MVEYLIKIAICFLLSICVGLERQYRHKIIGLRTNVLVSLGAFMFTSMSFNFKTSDVTRIAAQVVSGIGFLGAGVILKDGNRVKGLNTAATLWCVASIGVLCASNMLIEATIGTIFILIANTVLRLLSKYIMDKVVTDEICTLNINCNKNELKKIKNSIENLSSNYKFIIKNFEKKDIDDKNITITIKMISNTKRNFDRLVNYITSSFDINSIQTDYNKLLESDNEDIDEEAC